MEVISGFVNGIFLVFIAIFVLMESIERFIEPPHIETDRLLLVSTLVWPESSLIMQFSPAELD